MDFQAFKRWAIQNPLFKTVTCSDEGATVLDDKGGGYHISRESIEANELADIAAVLEGGKDPNPLHHMSRVVGYFSRIENWNKSKLGELKDRQKGNYNIKD